MAGTIVVVGAVVERDKCVLVRLGKVKSALKNGECVWRSVTGDWRWVVNGRWRVLTGS